MREAAARLPEQSSTEEAHPFGPLRD
jgi:hypothetical protein